jgi:hypothetical protein
MDLQTQIIHNFINISPPLFQPFKKLAILGVLVLGSDNPSIQELHRHHIELNAKVMLL